jgi:hypothetical protein
MEYDSIPPLYQTIRFMVLFLYYHQIDEYENSITTYCIHYHIHFYSQIIINLVYRTFPYV